MNRHAKLAFFLAPFLVIGGYVLSDLYLEDKASEIKVYQLQPNGLCDIYNQSCVLTLGELDINVTHQNGISVVNSTYPLDTATLFLVDSGGQPTTYRLGMKDSPYYWKRETPLGNYIEKAGQGYTLRFIGEIKGARYIAEFQTLTVAQGRVTKPN